MDSFVKRGYTVDLLLLYGGGNFENQINHKVNIVRLRSKNYKAEFLKTNKALIKIKFIILHLLSYINYFIKLQSIKKNTYKCVFVGLHGLNPKLIIKNLNYQKIFQFIRNDLILCDKTNKAHNHIVKYGKIIDYYVCVAGSCKESFDEKYPALMHKSIVIYNLLSAGNIIEKSKEIIDQASFFNTNSFKILSVCRIQEKSKGVLRIASLVKKMIDKRLDVVWYIVGSGEDEMLLKNKISELGIEKNLILLGRKPNPYPYMLLADVIAVPSYYEGLCGVVNEAKILKLPLLATQFSGINEQITNNVNGLIVKNSEDNIFLALEKLYYNKNLFNTLAVNKMPKEITDDDLKMNMLIDYINR